jgi:hypothetical protein
MRRAPRFDLDRVDPAPPTALDLAGAISGHLALGAAFAVARMIRAGGAASVALARLGDALGHVGDDLPLAALGAALLAAEQRLAGLERLAHEATDATAEDLARLHLARDVTAAELQAIAAALTRLRLDFSLAALGGERADLRARLGALDLRVRTLSEVAAIDARRCS